MNRCSLALIGRMALAWPWIFAAWGQPPPISYGKIWFHLFRYIREDFSPHLETAVQSAPTLEVARERADKFFGQSPRTVAEPCLMGL